MPRPLLFLFIIGWSCTSCDSSLVFSEFHELNNGTWQVGDTLEYHIQGLDSTQNHDIFFNVRNDETYPYSNLFLIAKFEYPNGNFGIDTLEYQMAEPSGKWLGVGVGSTKQNKLWYKENIKLSDSGVYTLKLVHAMRETGQVQGLITLKGLTDMGIEIKIAE